MNWKCPQCGETNPDTTKLCGLCGEMRPAVKAEPIVVRAMAPSVPAPPPLLPQVMPRADRWDSVDPAHPSEAEKKRLAEEAARQIMGTPASGAPSKVGCGTMAMFIMFLPWSLLVLPMPGGLRNKKVLQILLIIAAVVMIISIISGIMVFHSAMKYLPAIKGAYNVDPGD